jgi:hypothetical protein
MADDGARFLGIYLNDHLAGSTTAIEMVRRAAEQYDGTQLGAFFAAIGAEIEADRDTLKAVMAANGVEVQRYKLAAAWVAEKGARLKFNGALVRRSPLTPLVELETLAAGIHGKESLWRLLRAGAADEASAARFDELIERARSQREAVERHRAEAGPRALSPARAP